MLLCYNDGDLVAEAVQHLVEQGHHVIAWDHGSDDETAEVLDGLRRDLVELRTIPRSFDFYDLYQEMSRHLLAQWLEEVVASPYDWIEFRNVNYWWTSDDDQGEPSALRRVRHYSLFADCAPRIRSWRASATNLRVFNHNPPNGERYPTLFNLRHYPMRSQQQMLRRLSRDRAGLHRQGSNYHYDNMSAWPSRLTIEPSRLHVDDGGELNLDPIFDWRSIYGNEESLSNLEGSPVEEQ